MDVSLDYFLNNIAGNPILLITVLLTLGVIFVKRMDGCPECDRHLCDNAVHEPPQGDSDECGV